MRDSPIFIMELTRIFHPVGFGAFYTEKHVDPHTMKYFKIVYDCGTVTAGVNLDLMIQSRFNKGEQIDKINFFRRCNV